MPIDFDAILQTEYGDTDGAHVPAADQPGAAAVAAADQDLLQACSNLASEGGHESFFAGGLELLKAALTRGATGTMKNIHGLRAMDVLARGLDSMESAAGIEFMAEAGFAEEMMKPPGASEMPPMMAAAFFGNPLIVEKFLFLGMPADVQANAPRQKIIAGTPFHATVVGFRHVRKDDYASVLQKLLAYCPEGIDTPDAFKQKPIDLAVDAAIRTEDLTLVAALLQFGVSLRGAGGLGADQLIKALMERGGKEDLQILMATSEARRAIREVDAMRSHPRP